MEGPHPLTEARRTAEKQAKTGPDPRPPFPPTSTKKTSDPPRLAPMGLMNNLPYMGELTFDTRPRRGRKPKKADICHLITKNYGIQFPNSYVPTVQSDAPVAKSGKGKALHAPPLLPLRPLAHKGPRENLPAEEPLNLCVRDGGWPERPDLPPANLFSNFKRGAGERGAGKKRGKNPPASNSNLVNLHLSLSAANIASILGSEPGRRGEPTSLAPLIPHPVPPVSGRNKRKRPKPPCLKPSEEEEKHKGSSTAQVSICKFKFTGGAKPSLQEKKMLSVDAGGNFRFYTDKSSPSGGKSPFKTECDSPSLLPRSAKSMSMCMPSISLMGLSSMSPAASSTPSPCLVEQERRGSSGDEGGSSSGQSEAETESSGKATPRSSKPDKLKRKRRTRKSLMREKLEKTFKEKGFLIQTQQLESAEGATYCKFRQLRKFTRYLFRSWKDYLPDNVKEINAGPSAPLQPQDSSLSSPFDHEEDFVKKEPSFDQGDEDDEDLPQDS